MKRHRTKVSELKFSTTEFRTKLRLAFKFVEKRIAELGSQWT